MSEQAVPQPEPTEDEVNTTPPNPPANDGGSGWTMPKPVFRKSSGYLPQGFEKRFSDEEVRAKDDDNSTAEMPAPEFTTDVEPQPDLGEHSEHAPGSVPAETVAVPKKRSTAKIVLMTLGLLFALGLIAVIGAVVYFLYLMPLPSPEGPF